MLYPGQSTRISVLLTATVAVLCIVSVIAYDYWIGAPWFSPSSTRGAPMYNVPQWFATFIYHAVAPTVFCLLFPLIHYLLRASIKKSVFLFYTVAVVLLCGGVYCLAMALAPLDAFWECGFAFCYNIEKTKDVMLSSALLVSDDTLLSSAAAESISGLGASSWSMRGLGYRHLQGFQWAVPAVMLICVMLWSIASRLAYDCKILNRRSIAARDEKQQSLLSSLVGTSDAPFRAHSTINTTTTAATRALSSTAADTVRNGAYVPATNTLYYAPGYTPPTLTSSSSTATSTDIDTTTTTAVGSTAEQPDAIGSVQEQVHVYSDPHAHTDEERDQPSDRFVNSMLNNMYKESPAYKRDMRNILPNTYTADKAMTSAYKTGSAAVSSAATPYITSYGAAPRPFFTTLSGRWLLFLMLLVPTGFLFFTSLYLPNLWRSWTTERIASNAAVTVAATMETCLAGKGTCPEYEWAWVHTRAVEIADGLVLKLYPSNIFFYSILVFLPLLALLSQTSKRLDRFLNRKVCVPTGPRDAMRMLYDLITGSNNIASAAKRRANSAVFSLREVATVVFLAVFLSLFTSYWFSAHNYKQYWPKRHKGGDFDWIVLPERLCRTAGQVAVAFFSLLMFPAARNSPLLAIMGVSWESALMWHRWLGVLFLLATLAHAVTAYWWYWRENMMALVWQIPYKLWGRLDDYTVPLIQWLCVPTLLCFTIGAFAACRRKHYNLFLTTHQLSYLILVPAVLVHASAAWEYLAPGLIVWFVDRVVRLFRSQRAVTVMPPTYEPMYEIPGTAAPTALGYSAYNPAAMSDVSGGISASTGVLSYSATAITNATTTNTATASMPLAPLAYTLSPPSISVRKCGAAGDIIELRLRAPGFRYLPGQYLWLNIAEISLFEWHPITIASPVHGAVADEVVLLIKSMGKNTWSGCLFQYIWEKQHKDANSEMHLRQAQDHISTLLPADRPTLSGIQGNCGIPGVFIPEMYSVHDYLPVPLTISLDGPHGNPPNFMQYDDVVLVGGGIGVTPCKSIFESMYLSYIHDYLPTHMNHNAENGTAPDARVLPVPASSFSSLSLLSAPALPVHRDNSPSISGVTSPISTSAYSTTSTTHLSSFPSLMATASRTTSPSSSHAAPSPSRVHLLALARDPSLFAYLAPTLPHIPLGPFSMSLVSTATSHTPMGATTTTSADARPSTMMDDDGTTHALLPHTHTDVNNIPYDVLSDHEANNATDAPPITDMVTGVGNHIHHGRIDVAASVRALLKSGTPAGPASDEDYLIANVEAGHGVLASSTSSSTTISHLTATSATSAPVSTFATASQVSSSRRVLVLACGPLPLVHSLEITCAEEGWDFHKEEFDL